MYVISLKWREKQGQPVASYVFILMTFFFFKEERPRAFGTHPANFTPSEVQKVVVSYDQTAAQPPPRPVPYTSRMRQRFARICCLLTLKDLPCVLFVGV